MTSLTEIRLIHLSDLHFGEKHICAPEDVSGAARGIPLLKDLIREDLANNDCSSSVWPIETGTNSSAPLLVLATGDLTERAAPNEFDQACDLLNSLAGQTLLGTKIDLKHVFVVPGNHDVLFSEPNPEHRFAPYCQFYNKLYKSIQPNGRPYTRPEESHGLSRIHTFPDSRFLVAEVNSCYYVERETLDESRGQVDLRTIAALRSSLERCNPECNEWIKIALMHHHPVLFPSFLEPGRGVDSVLNAKSLLRLLRDQGFHLLLHGHKHYPQVFYYDPESAWETPQTVIPQLIVAGGSCGSSLLPPGINRCNTYNFITLKWDPDKRQARVQIVTRGLTRTGPSADLDPDQWSWQTLRAFDKRLPHDKHFCVPKSECRVPLPESPARHRASEDMQDHEHRSQLPTNSKYYQRISDLIKDCLGAQGMNIDALVFGDQLTLADLEFFCTRVYYRHKSESDVREELRRARAAAFTTKYAESREDEKMVNFKAIKLPGLRSWDSYIKEVLNDIGANGLESLDILDVGIGNGCSCKQLYRGLHRLQAVDISLEALRKCEKELPSTRVFNDEAEDLKSIKTASIDLYLSFRTYQSTLFDRRAALLEGYRVLRRAGFIVISIPTMFIRADGEARYDVLPGLLMPPHQREPSMEYAREMVNRIAELLRILNFKEVQCRDRSPFEIYVCARR